LQVNPLRKDLYVRAFRVSPRCDIALLGGRVIDPESGLDAVRHVGIVDGHVAAVTPDRLDAAREIDVSGLVVAPGFIDLHSHAQSLSGARLQAMDGVTTALELEAGAIPVDAAYARAAREGRPIHFGFSAGWALARLAVMTGAEWSTDDPRTPIEFFEDEQARERWGAPSDERELAAILQRIGDGLDEGGIGVGVLLGYAPGTDRAEFQAVAALAAARGMPVFTHSRTMSMVGPGSSGEGIAEIVRVAESSGAHVHVCHLNSTSLRLIGGIGSEITAAQARGVRLSTEAYPYGAGSTGIGAAFFDPDRFARLGVPTTAVRYLPTGERIAGLDRLAELRRTDPGGLCTVDLLDLERPDDLELLLEAITMPGGAIASDAMPLVVPGGSRIGSEWPPPAGARVHPRSAGTFARTLGWLVRELGVLDLTDAIRRMSLTPAALLEQAAPAMRRKGRLQVGADADIVVFDADQVADAATFDEVRPSIGIRHVLVDGRFVIEDTRLDPTASPGRPVRGSGPRRG
jgi:dihydroorotase-like cyclic amidohydrolase